MSTVFGTLHASFTPEKQDAGTQILTCLKILLYCFENAHSANIKAKIW